MKQPIGHKIKHQTNYTYTVYNIYYFDVRRCSIYQETKTGSGIRYVKLERIPQITWVLVEDRSGNGIVREA